MINTYLNKIKVKKCSKQTGDEVQLPHIPCSFWVRSQRDRIQYLNWIGNLKRKWQRTDLFVLHQPLRRARITSLFVTETQKAAIFVGRFRVCFLSNRIIGENFFCWVLLLCYFTCWNKGQKWQTGPETTSDIPKKKDHYWVHD